jgi:hypothetical protein
MFEKRVLQADLLAMVVAAVIGGATLRAQGTLQVVAVLPTYGDDDFPFGQ